MATEFPHAHFVSLDLVPMVPHVPRSNITFEVYDLYAGLAEPDDSFDIVHARDCISAVSSAKGYYTHKFLTRCHTPSFTRSKAMT
jgi:hypothetical protein